MSIHSKYVESRCACQFLFGCRLDCGADQVAERAFHQRNRSKAAKIAPVAHACPHAACSCCTLVPFLAFPRGGRGLSGRGGRKRRERSMGGCTVPAKHLAKGNRSIQAPPRWGCSGVVEKIHLAHALEAHAPWPVGKGQRERAWSAPSRCPMERNKEQNLDWPTEWRGDSELEHQLGPTCAGKRPRDP